MPEGPEVSVIKDGLVKAIKGKYIKNITFPIGSKFLKKSPDGYLLFQETLPIKVLDVKSKGKFIYIVCQDNWIIYCRLLMSGGWFYKEQPKNNHLRLEYIDNKNSKESDSIWFVDPRHFGQIKFSNNPDELDKELSKIGLDLLNQSDEINHKDYLETLRKHNSKTIAKVLMEQSIYSGIGNYLKSEILYQAKVSPHALIKNLPDEKIIEILDISKEKIKTSYLSGGASVRNYSDIEGKDGKYSFVFQVYGREKDPHGNKIKKETTKDGRTSHWVPEIQLSYDN